MPQTQFPTQNMNDIIAWTNAAAAEHRANPDAPRPCLKIPAAMMLGFGGWRLLPPPPAGSTGMLEEESTTWTLQRPFECDGQRFLIHYPTEKLFLRDDCLYQGWSFELEVRIDDGGTALELVSARRLEGRPIEIPDDRQEKGAQLLSTIQVRLPELQALWEKVSSHWGYEDPIYRYYHNSFKVYRVQQTTLDIFRILQSLMPDRYLNMSFCRIVRAGTGQVFEFSHNVKWDEHTRPMLEAFFHARHMLDMALKYGRQLTEAPRMLPSGWATVLYLYGLR